MEKITLELTIIEAETLKNILKWTIEQEGLKLASETTQVNFLGIAENIIKKLN